MHLGMRTPCWLRPFGIRRGSCGTPQISTRSPTSASWQKSWSRTPLPIWCSSAIRALKRWKAASRPRAATTTCTAIRKSTASSARATPFHGRTLATIAAANNPKHLEGFGPAVDGFDHVAFNNLNETRAAITEETAAILVEPIQGEGGITPADLDYLRALRAVCDEFGCC